MSGVSPALALNRESNISLRDTVPEESPDSNSDIVRMRTVVIRPIPLWNGVAPGVSTGSPLTTSGGVDDPHRMNWPLAVVPSQALRTPSHIAGTVCHSSIRCGLSPSIAWFTSAFANLRLL